MNSTLIRPGLFANAGSVSMPGKIILWIQIKRSHVKLQLSLLLFKCSMYILHSIFYGCVCRTSVRNTQAACLIWNVNWMLQRRHFHLGRRNVRKMSTKTRTRAYIYNAAISVQRKLFRMLLYRYFDVFNAVVMTDISNTHAHAIEWMKSFSMWCQLKRMTQTSLIEWINAVSNKHHVICLSVCVCVRACVWGEGCSVNEREWVN